MQKRKLIFVLTTLTLVMISYQNCAQVHFDSSMAAAAGVEGLPNGDGAPPAAGDDSQPVTKIGNQSAANCKDVIDSLGEAMPVLDGGKVSDVRGNAFYSGYKIAALQNNQGAIKVGSAKADAKIDMIDNEAGLLYICNMDVAKIQNSNGRIIVVGGDVGDVSNFSGQLDVIGGKIIGQVADSTGVIKVN